jgi:phosphoribosylformimino-5-aminoimidazole carboxamide ribotide isomerase
VLKRYNGEMVPVNPGSGDTSSSDRFALLPAIDLRGGHVVRLRQGDFARETDYGDDPVTVALAFADSGARWLHVVDLDGARAGSPQQTPLIREIVAAVSGRMQVEVGGGLRDVASVEAILATGANRVVVGTAALADPSFAGRLVDSHGEDRVVVALDVRDGLAVGSGWRVGAPGVPILDAATRITDEGVGILAVTAIDRDGLLEGPDLTLLETLVALGAGQIIASGGISSTADVLETRRVGCTGAIVGRSLYEGRLDLAATLSALRAGPPA